MKRQLFNITGALLSLLVLGAFSAAAQLIQPSGEPVGTDKQGHTIYRIHANGIEIGYKLMGSGEPLVMITGLGGTMESWPQEVLEAFAKKHQLILMDNRGMGHTTANDVTFTYKLFADDVVGLLAGLGVKKADVLGFSMGSTIAQELLLDYPQRFNKAIIYATSTDGSQVAAVLRGKIPDDPTVVRQLEATTHWKTPLDKLPFITNQVLFVVGTADTVVGVESSKVLACAIPGAWLAQFRNASHQLMREAPGEFAKTVLTFLETNATIEMK